MQAGLIAPEDHHGNCCCRPCCAARIGPATRIIRAGGTDDDLRAAGIEPSQARRVLGGR